MKFLMLLLVIILGILAGEVNFAKATTPTVLGYLNNVAVPAAEKRKENEAKLKLNQQTKIVGGSVTEEGQVPYQAGLVIDIIGINGVGICGASLVSSNRLLTAAHCWFDGLYQAWRFTVVLGSQYIFLLGNTAITEQTSVVITHPRWNPYFITNDIAVVYIPTAITVSDTISPISLPTYSETATTFVGFNAKSSGFGLTSDDAGIALNQTLSQVSLEVISNFQCWWYFPLTLRRGNICTSGDDGTGPCNGDSGGPLVTEYNNRTVLIGITSFGSSNGCASGPPTVFTRVTSFYDFIHSHII